MVAGVAAAALGGVYLWNQWNAGPASADDEGPPLTEDEVNEIFAKILRGMQQFMASLLQNMKALQAQVPPEQLQALVLNEFEKQVQKYQTEVFAQYNADEEDVEESTTYYLEKGSESVKKQVDALKDLYSQVGGSVETDLPEDLDIDKMLVVLEEYFDAFSQANAIVQEQVMRSGGNPSPQQQEEMKVLVTRTTDSVLQKFGLNNAMFQAACKEFQSHPKFTAKAQELEAKAQMRQQAQAQALGLI